MSAIRIKATPHVIVRPKDASVSDVIQKESAKAAVVFLGLATPEEGKEGDYAVRIEKLAGNLPTVFLVKNSSLFVGELLGATDNATTGPGDEVTG